MDKKKIIAITLFIFMGFFMFAFANPADGIYKEDLGNENQEEQQIPNVDVIEANENPGEGQVVVPGNQPQQPVVPINNPVEEEVVVGPANISLNQDNKNIIEVFSEIPKFIAVANDVYGNIVPVTITHNINNAKLGKYLVTFSANDGQGNIISETMDFYVVDTTKPVINLKGNVPHVLRKNNTYVESGATVIDNYDTDLDDEVKITGKVDVTKSNIVELKYNVEDRSGNVADEVTRKVHVVDVDKLENAIEEANDIIDKIKDKDVKEELKKLVDELEQEKDKGKDIIDNKDSLQDEVDEQQEEIDEIIEKIKNMTFTVRFVDYDDSEIAVRTVKIFEKVDYPVNPTRRGYIFNGWSEKVEEVYNDLTIKATYLRGTSEITVNIYHEELDGNYTKTNSFKISAPTDLRYNYSTETPKTGFEFNYELTNTDAVALADGSATINIYYNRIVSTASFYLNQRLVEEKDYKFGAQIEKPEYQVPTGYHVEGWDNLGTMPANDVEFYGELVKNIYKVKFLVDGEEYAVKHVQYGEDVDMTTISNPTKEPSATTIYTFDKWEGQTTNITEDTEVIAKFNEEQRYFTVTFMVDNNVYRIQKVESGKDVDMSNISNPTKESTNTINYKFTGWDKETTNITEDRVINAIFEETTRLYKVTVKYYIGNKLNTKEYEVEYEGTIKLPETTKRITLDNGRTYQDFTGWSNNFSNTTKVIKNMTVVAEYNRVESATSNVYVLKYGEERPQNGEPHGNEHYDPVSIKVNILDGTGKLAKVMEEARKSSTNEAVLALNNDVSDYLSPESIKLLNDYQHSVKFGHGFFAYVKKYKVNWYVLKYNTSNGWHLDGEMIYNN